MNAHGEAPSLHQQALDWLFTRLAGNAPEPLAEPPPPAPTGPALADEVPSPPEVESDSDLKAGAEWLRRERQRLEAYTRAQLTRIQQEHQNVLQQNYLNEQALIMRSQELARREEMLQAQGRAVQEQAHELSQREQGLAAQLQQWWQANEQLALLEMESAAVREDAARNNEVLLALKSETAALQQSRESARSELDQVLQAAREQQEARAREEESFRDRKAQLEGRLYAAEKAALAAEQRQAELDDLEARLRREMEEQEADLQARSRDLEAQERQLRLTHTAEQAKVKALQSHLEQRLEALGREEAALAQRQAELDDWGEQLEASRGELVQFAEELEHRKQQLVQGERQREERRLPAEVSRRMGRAPAHRAY